SVMMRDGEATVRTLQQLKRLGVKLAIDDFGTGYSSLAQLKQLPVDVVKLDRSFVAGLPGDVRDREIVGAVLRIGRNLGFDVVAEGIETAEQERALRDAGCRYGQGFYLGRPMPVHDLAGLLEKRHTVAS
ncbi:MAG TPA: EAL domain-containing protein, partial [Candidatus Elarobacter sp.]